MNRSKRYSPEGRERAVRLVFDLQKEDQSAKRDAELESKLLSFKEFYNDRR